MEIPDHQTNPCAICLSGMGAGGGQATFTAECSHTFHSSCISASVCPLCSGPRHDLPFRRPTPPPPPPPPPLPPPPPPPPPRVRSRQAQPQCSFDDDEQVGPASGPPAGNGSPAAASNEAVVIKTRSEYPVIAMDLPSDNFAVLVHVQAPGMTDITAAGGDAPRTPVDLVTVLDVSHSMSGQKLTLLKQAMRFVIANLGPDDRLSVVSFNTKARRVTRLTRMSEAGKALSVSAVESLTADGCTDIAEGLRMAAMVLDQRRHRNAVSSVGLLSEGPDNYIMMRHQEYSGVQANDYEDLVPPTFARTGADGEWSASIHTFGFGNDHDATAMHVIAEATGGTFSFVENEAVIQDAFAQCIGGLLSVVVQEARIAVACVHPGVRVMSVKSGSYESRIDEDGRAATVWVGELYADEERRFLLILTVPRAEATDGDTTALLNVSFSCRDAATGMDVNVSAKDTLVARPEHAADAKRSVEVERERVRVDAAEDIAAARAAAERGEHQEAVAILKNRQRAVALSEAASDGDPVTMALEAELQEMRGRVSNRQSYALSGRAYMLAGISAHQQQRATSRQMNLVEEMSVESMAALAAAPPVKLASNEATLSYATPAMHAMLLRSRRAREASAEQGQQLQAEEEYTGSSEHGQQLRGARPPSFARTGFDGEWSAPIHTFGFGNDHDTAAMHAIADATGGMFSFIENEVVIQDAFAQCIGGLPSVVVQGACIAVACVHPGVRVMSVKSGSYKSRINEDGRAATVWVGELYAEEERRFLLSLAVPRAEATDGDAATLVKVVFSYRNAATGADVSVTTEDTVVARPEHAPNASERSVEVERERIRVEAAEDFTAARAAAERGDHREAVKILNNRQRAVALSQLSRDDDPVIMALEAELWGMCGRVANRQRYARSGPAYML
uniref:VWFA domain-containing protein n=1 Tax=Aegilops tauschii TaxID=37682 RepID=R7W0Y9_AEGTA